MASFSRYETTGFKIQTRVTCIPLKRAKKPSKTLHFNTRHQQLHLTFYEAIKWPLMLMLLTLLLQSLRLSPQQPSEEAE